MSTKEKSALRYQKSKELNLCVNCRCRPKIDGLSRCEICKDKQKERYTKKKETDPDFILNNRKRSIAWGKANKERRCEITRTYRKKKREIVIEHYGNKCACCGETEEKFLTIDHINGDGKEHRKQIGVGGAAIHSWLIKNNFPDGFQLLCFNCNCAKGFWGECPHQSKK